MEPDGVHFTSEKRKIRTACFPQKKVELRTLFTLSGIPVLFSTRVPRARIRSFRWHRRRESPDLDTQGIMETNTEQDKTPSISLEHKTYHIDLVISGSDYPKMAKSGIETSIGNGFRLRKQCVWTEFKILKMSRCGTIIRLTKSSSSLALWMKN